jgi:hypothetical protein
MAPPAATNMLQAQCERIVRSIDRFEKDELDRTKFENEEDKISEETEKIALDQKSNIKLVKILKAIEQADATLVNAHFQTHTSIADNMQKAFDDLVDHHRKLLKDIIANVKRDEAVVALMQRMRENKSKFDSCEPWTLIEGDGTTKSWAELDIEGLMEPVD